jgi:hypothetical protein
MGGTYGGMASPRSPRASAAFSVSMNERKSGHNHPNLNMAGRPRSLTSGIRRFKETMPPATDRDITHRWYQGGILALQSDASRATVLDRTDDPAQ